MKHLFFIPVLLLFFSSALFSQTRIDRKALVTRHNVINTKPDSLSSLTVGNGRFAFTVDVTGLQSFPKEYQKGVPLGTQSEWGWHSFINTNGYRLEEAIKEYELNGRKISYTVQWNNPQRNKDAANWFRQNPHRLQLGNLGFEFQKKDGSLAGLQDIQNIQQELNLWTGEIKSHFTIEGMPVDVYTVCHGKEDVIGGRVESPLIKEGRLKIRMRFPYPTGEWTDEGTNWSNEEKHQTSILLSHLNGAVLTHQLDSTKYYVGFWWKGEGIIRQKNKHYFLITPREDNSSFEFTAKFTRQKDFSFLPQFTATEESSESSWTSFWNSGGAIDFSGSTDKRAAELERRIVLSQYLLKTQEAGSFPPQETGLTYNSWFGKPHLEMHWWHSVHYALWGRTDLLEKSVDWYFKVAGNAKKIAQRQGFDGLRWQKMTNNEGEESPSTIGAFLIWQQPHFIYFAELLYRSHKDVATLNKYKDLVFATADFMASFPVYDNEKKRYNLGKGLVPAQERYKPEETFNPAFELAYWHWALSTAQQWRKRLKLAPNKKWADVLSKLAPLPQQQGVYLAAESAPDSYTNPEYKTDHPSVLGSYGVLPYTKKIDTATMNRTFNLVWNMWTWVDTWGWDFPMTAMTATRLNQPGKAIDALLMNIRTNTYLSNGHNYQDERLRLYLPGNGGMLAAVAMMVAGYDNAGNSLPGIPKNGSWKVKWEGLKKMP